MKFLIVCCFFIGYYKLLNVVGNCNFKIPQNKYGYKLPNYLRDGQHVMLYENNRFYLDQKEMMVLSCGGDGNKLYDVEQRNYLEGEAGLQLVHAGCKSDDLVTIKSRTHKFGNLRCEKDLGIKQEKLNTGCSNNKGVKYRFLLTLTSFVSKIGLVVCYDEAKATVLYTQHELYGKALRGQRNLRECATDISNDGIPSDLNMQMLFEQEYIKTRIRTLSNRTKLQKRIEVGYETIVPTFVASPGDILYVPWRKALHRYINIVPMWSTNKFHNWRMVEAKIRQSAYFSGKMYDIVTGTHDVYTIKTASGNTKSFPTKLYLADSERVPVPKYIFKVVQDRVTKNAIVIITLNKMSSRRPFHQSDIFCKDICEETNWIIDRNRWKNPTLGIVFCCSFDDFTKTVTTVSLSDTIISVNGTLRANE